MSIPRFSLSVLCTAALSACVAAQIGRSIGQTRHNLATTGPGEIRAQARGDTCVFCHAPHRNRRAAPLWNREDSVTTYLTYRSSTFEGDIGQPNGSSKLCLSCHDGTVALGKVVSQSHELPMRAGHRFLTQGRGSLGANLRDDHPISFAYATSQGGTGVGFRPASAIVPPVRLDDRGEVQCTSCHDPHDNQHGYFLRLTDQQSSLCLSCHDPVGWPQSAHATSPATWNGSGPSPWPEARYGTVRDNGCGNCHESHGAGRPERLLRFANEEDNCLRCHGGNVAGRRIGADLGKPSAHRPSLTTGVHDPIEDPMTMPRHAECQDCHDPHRAVAGAVPAPGVPGPLQGTSGINSVGAVIAEVGNGFEVCFKCHADNHGTSTAIPRQILELNTRLEFDPGGPSYHPVVAPGINPDVPSLLPPWTTASLVACTDCHAGNDSPDFGGNGARGPHGSIYAPILGARYETRDGTPESPAAYALCYRCHNRSSILGDASFGHHRRHIATERTPCSVCHDAHGISAKQGSTANHSHLINFDTSIVTPNRAGRLEFLDLGGRRGSCSLTCHGEEHNDAQY